MDGAYSTYGRKGVVREGFWWGSLRERIPLEGPGVDGSVILKWIIWKWNVGAWIGLIWLRIGAGGGHL